MRVLPEKTLRVFKSLILRDYVYGKNLLGTKYFNTLIFNKFT